MKTIFSLLFICFTSDLFAQAPLNEWAWQIGGANDDNIYSLTLDNDNNIYAAGSVNGLVDLNPDNTVVNINQPPGPYPTFFINKHDSNGSLIWSLFDQSSEQPNADPSNTSVIKSISYKDTKLVVMGEYAGLSDNDLKIEDALGTSFLFNSNGAQDLFITVLNAGGEIQAARTIGGLGNEIAGDVRFDQTGAIWLCGVVSHSAGSDQIELVPDLLIDNPSSNHQTIFLAKFDGNLNGVFALTLGDIDLENNGNNLHIDCSLEIDSDGNAVILGNFVNTIQLDPLDIQIQEEGRRMFLAKYSSEGTYIWGGTFGDFDPSETADGNDFANDLTIDLNNVIYISARVGNESNFSFTGDEFLASATGTSRIVIARYTSAGVCTHIEVFPGESSSTNQDCFTLTTDEFGSVLGCGTVSNSINLNGTTISGTPGGMPFWFCMNFNTNGSWIDAFGTSDQGSGRAIVVTPAIGEAYSIYLGGGVNNELVPSVYPSLPHFDNAPFGDGRNAFLAKYSAFNHAVICGDNGVDNCPADLNADGFINAADLLLFLGFFGASCN